MDYKEFGGKSIKETEGIKLKDEFDKGLGTLGVVTVKLLDALKDIGVDVSQKQGSNVKTLATKNKSSATKPGLLASERYRWKLWNCIRYF